MLRMKESNSGLVGYKLFFLQPCFLGIRGFKSHLPHYKVIMNIYNASRNNIMKSFDYLFSKMNLILNSLG